MKQSHKKDFSKNWARKELKNTPHGGKKSRVVQEDQ